MFGGLVVGEEVEEVFVEATVRDIAIEEEVDMIRLEARVIGNVSIMIGALVWNVKEEDHMMK